MSASEAAMTDAPPATILVVDDDPLSRTLQARLLGLLGHRAEVVASPLDALEVALGGQVDGMLLDLGMPELDGFALIEQLRAKESSLGRRPLPVIAVTGYAAHLDRLRCLMAGFNDHLTKPIDVGALGEALARHVAARCRDAARHSDAQRVEDAARRLAQVKPGDNGFGPTLLETFAMRSGQLIEEITQAQALNDGAAMRHALKALRSSAEFMGATGMAGLCARLQASLDGGGDGERDALIKNLSEEHLLVLTLLLRAPRAGAARESMAA